MSTRWTELEAAQWLRQPGPADNKYGLGVLGVRTGSAQYPGAAVLTVSAGWRTGVGLLRYVPPAGDAEPPFGLPSPASAVLAARPETVFGAADSRACDAWLIGSGTDPAARSAAETAILSELLSGPQPVVVDAGALGVVADRALSAPNAAAPRTPTILTPHAGEFARLWQQLGMGTPPTALKEPFDTVQRSAAATELATALGATVLLKGTVSICATPGGIALHTGPATPRLATAGSGDVLAGILGALVTLNAERVQAQPELLGALGSTAALLHDLAAHHAAGSAPVAREARARAAVTRRLGAPILALDIAAALPTAIADLLTRATA
ncbi:NAD(P)H-hydrate repair Nnr-like enzyme with NAD(P)H-hydrate dehydratase domain [Leucobacter luti]|uniref:ADP-dependent NAD(P)H-hydrate dehydratase n=1 Tax=Leucobacter luti TaxID=340320 RepID=UPI00104A6E42|nr:ADP/ATP-dependent (S)-NAD(P)H-hydrate dehydratase [Leucobacter luti]MCW2288871.1 NAD(P)H-hydrate repair Nnr-like enzyme with NAD(P)H-hydrate dehydratase domain [Leucobacter luti]TCK44977.1 NAD(P)H-hydrate repair Nnr-like enzyme with NAD(P)H-hydrate dehydratase domain [Leucobacter luti]